MVVTNHSRASMYFTETMGMVLGRMHTAIQISCAMITQVMGCRQMRGSMMLRSNPSLIRKSRVRPTMIGSVGSETPMPPRSSSSKLMESGVAKARKISKRSTAANMAQTTMATTGKRLNQ